MNVTINFRTVGKWKENSYLVQLGNEGWMIDPGDEFELLNLMVVNQGCQLKGIINTHGHFDHLGAIADFQNQYNLPFYIHSKDKQLVRQGNLYRKLAGDPTTFQTPVITEFLDKMPGILLGNYDVILHHVPGHTYGSVCFQIDKALFTGDLFFADTIGRTDLPGGNKPLLVKSIEFVLENFQGYLIYPGHGQPFVLDEKVIKRLKQQL